LNFKVVKWANVSFQICLVTTLSVPAAFVFVPSVFGKNIPTVEFGMRLAETACWETERK
jgi:hypothetical protein